MQPVRLGIVGAGYMGREHALGFRELPGVEIVAICDQNPEAAGRLAEEIGPGHSVRLYTNWEELVEAPDLQGVVITVPNFLHHVVAERALRAGKHVLLEKPLATTAAGARAVIRAARESGRQVQIGLVYRYSHLYNRMAEILAEGQFGTVSLLWCKEFRASFPPHPWFYSEEASGGALVEKNCHHFDLFNWFAGSRPKKVFAMGGQHVIRAGEPTEVGWWYVQQDGARPLTVTNSQVVDHAWVTIEYESGARANLGLCLYLRPNNLSEEGLEVGLIGSSGAQMVAYANQRIGLSGGPYGDLQYITPDRDTFSPWHIGGQQERIEFLETVRTGRQPRAGLTVGLDSLLVALAAERSIKEERVVYLSEVADA
jgi:predicted dehydrogenase